MAGGIKREQTRELASQVNTRQDRNIHLTDGGTWSWDAGTRTLSWTANATLSLGGVLPAVLAGPGSIVLGLTPGRVLYAVVDRASGGASLVPGASLLEVLSSDTALSADDVVSLGIVGVDQAFYFRNGTVLANGDHRAFGQFKGLTDRSDVTASGGTTYTPGWPFVTGDNGLGVYVGGMLLSSGAHYTENSPAAGQITFTPGNVPAAGELITFLNVLGAQGPAGGASSLQLGYNAGAEILTAGGTPVKLHNATSTETLLSAGVGPLAADSRARLQASGFIDIGPGAAGVGNAGVSIQDNAGADLWMQVPLDDGSGDLIIYNTGSGQGVRIAKATGALAFGSYTGAYGLGTWADEGPNGALQWAVAQGTIPANPIIAPLVVNLGLSNMVLALVSISDKANPGWVLGSEYGNAQLPNRQHATVFNNTTGDIHIAPTPISTAQFGSFIEGEAYTLVVLYQG